MVLRLLQAIVTNCPWGHPHKQQFIALLTEPDQQLSENTAVSAAGTVLRSGLERAPFLPEGGGAFRQTGEWHGGCGYRKQMLPEGA